VVGDLVVAGDAVGVDGVQDGDAVAWARHHYGVTIEIVARPEGQQGFQVLPRCSNLTSGNSRASQVSNA
jgi:hypothetical protein